MDLTKAKEVCAELAELKKRWGRHAGNGQYSDATIREALLCCHEAGLFDIDEKHADVVLANRQKGAAEARATKYKNELDAAQEKLKEALQELEKSKKSESKRGFFN